MHSHEDKDGLLETQRSHLRHRCREEHAIFLGNLSRQDMYSPNLPMDSPKGRNGLSVLLVDCPFYGKIAFLEKFQFST